MLRIPSPNDGSTIDGPNSKIWFEQWFKNPNIDLENSVAFAKKDVLELLNQPSCKELLISKQVHQGKNTLAMVGIGTGANLQIDTYPEGNQTKDHLVLVGTYFNPPTKDGNIDLDFSAMKGVDAANRHIGWETHYDSNGSYNEVIGSYKVKPKYFNHFSTVSFSRSKILPKLTQEVDKIAFLNGYVTLIQKDLGHPEDNKHVGVTTQIAIETLVAVLMDENDNVIDDPIVPIGPWPVRWKKYE